MTSSRTPRQSDVAELTGLSQTTVSRVLRDDPAVLPETRERVRRACEALGYRVSIGGRLLAAGPRATVGLSLSGEALPTDRYVSITHQCLAAEFESAGWSTLLLPADSFEARLSEIGAAILVGVARRDDRLRLCAARSVPCVAIGHPEGSVFAVAPDDAEGGRLAARHLVRAGRRSLTVLSSAGDAGDPGLLARRDGFLSEAASLGVRTRTLVVDRLPTATLAGYRSAPRAAEGADGLFCDTDEHAVGALYALRDAGTSVGPGGDVGLVGFDDLPRLAEAEELTTVRQDVAATVREAAALRREAARELTPRRVTTPVEMIVRRT